MQIAIENVVLHILDTQVGMPVLSQKEMVLEPETVDFVTGIVQRVLKDDRLKSAHFYEDNNPVRDLITQMIRGEIDLLAASKSLASSWFELMTTNPQIPAADLICSRLEIDGESYLGLFKLNYRANYIHHVQYEEDSNVNLLIKQKTVLPGENQRLEECALINLGQMTIQLIEKEYEMFDGKRENYLSELFLRCKGKLSNMETVKILSKTAEKISKERLNEDFGSVARLNKTITERFEDTNRVTIADVAQDIFKENSFAQNEYMEELKKAGLNEGEIQLPEKLAERKFAKHKIKTDTGIEIYFPSTYFDNKDIMEFANNPDGTITIVIKNVGKIFNK